jgi:hypothetical protein
VVRRDAARRSVDRRGGRAGDRHGRRDVSDEAVRRRTTARRRAERLKARIVESLDARAPAEAADVPRLARLLDVTCTDAATRAELGIDDFIAGAKARGDAFLREDVAARVFRAFDEAIDSQVRAGTTLAAARRWADADLWPALWDRVAAETELPGEEVRRLWDARDAAPPRDASYGTGSFAASPAGEATSPPVDVAESPVGAEAWWRDCWPSGRLAWLAAHVAETSGVFVVTKAQDSPCRICAGARVYADKRICGTCNGRGTARRVFYR